MRALLLVLLGAWSLSASATHILGGEISYTYLGNNNYAVTLKLYRDCGPENTQNTALDAIATIGVFNSAGVWVKNANFMLPGEVIMPVTVGNPCLTVPPTICTRMGTYNGIINLPSGTGGYTLSYQRCCRSPSVVNILAPNTQGMTCTVRVPDPNITGANSSPAFDTEPPLVLCLNQTTVLDQLATDPDGDSLVYALAAPFNGGTATNPAPVPPSAPPYTPVIWAAGYSTQNQVSSDPPMSFGQENGVLTLHPSMIGNFAVSISVSEYRNGVLLSTVIRDFRFLVVACSQVITSAFAEQTEFCDGLDVQMTNHSVSSDTYHWDFGVPGTDSDTSNAVNPSFTYPMDGVYTITLVANPGWPCSDTSYQTYEVYEQPEITFISPGAICSDELPISLSATGTYSPGAQITWDFGTGVSPNMHSAQTTVGWSELGEQEITITVDDHGCTDQHTGTVKIFPLPQPSFSIDDPSGCSPFLAAFSNNSTAWTPMHYLWDLGDGTFSTDSLPVHEYTAPGHYSVSLSVTTDSGCVATQTLVQANLIHIWDNPVAAATGLPQVTTVLYPEVTFQDHSTNAVAWDFEVEGVHYDTPSFTHSFYDAGWYRAYLTVTDPNGCTDTTSVRIFIGDHLFFAPTAFSPDGDGHNEIWKPSVKGAREYQLDVFDRWGRVVFSTTDPDAGWDGAGAAPGIYAYKAWLTEWGPMEKEYNGSFVLIK